MTDTSALVLRCKAILQHIDDALDRIRQQRHVIVPEATSFVDPAGMRLSFATDVEGNLDYWHNFVQCSQVLSYTDRQQTELELAPDGLFVFGGDAPDKGPGDIRFVRQVVALKKKYPKRVFLLIGNRDANKLRFASELQPDVVCDAQVRGQTNQPYWIPAEKRVTPAAYVAKHGSSGSDLVDRCKWILDETMGAQGQFDRRRTELAAIRGVDAGHVPDQDVAQSFKSCCLPGHPDAFMLDYLLHAQLAVVIGNTLFVHGAALSGNYGSVPGRQSKQEAPVAWAAALNAYARRELQAFVDSPDWHRGGTYPRPGTDYAARAGAGLMDYGVPGGNHDKTVVYAKYGNEGPDPSVASVLAQHGIAHVISGHQPHGDCPLVMRTPHVTFITADTSYSDVKADDNRGCAVSEVLIESGTVRVHGVLASGEGVAYDLGADTFIGCQTRDGRRVKGKLGPDRGEYLVCKTEGFKVLVDQVPLAQVKELLEEELDEDSMA